MEPAEAEARRIVEQRWDECSEAHKTYFCAKKKAIAEALEPLEHLHVASEAAIAAYREASVAVTKFSSSVSPYLSGEGSNPPAPKSG